VKIVYVTQGVFDKGGIARYNRYQVTALREAYGDANVRVLSLAGRDLDDIEEPFAVSFSGANPLSKSSRVLFATAVAKEVAAFRPNAILSGHVNFGPMALALRAVCRTHLIQNVYGRELWPSGGLGLRRRRALRKTNLVIADCHNTADRAVELHLATQRPQVVWDCVDTSRHLPGPPDWRALSKYGIRDDNRFRVLFLGRLKRETRYKGLERMLQIVSTLPGDRVAAVVAGKGDDLTHIRQLCATLGISDRTTITGSIDERDLTEIYRSASAFYLVSSVGGNMGEGIPLTPMEAMACGVPVLTGDQDGSRELLDTGGGWCGAPEDLNSQRTYLEAIVSDPALHERERRTARERAVSAFGYDRFAAETIRAIDRHIPSLT
jgi:phosphatidyl-myo-inositol dimannoside synthase